jgi:hypothetical protein
MIASIKDIFVLNSFCQSKAGDTTTQDNKNILEQTKESGSLDSTDQANGKQLEGVKASASDLAGKVSEIEKELAYVSTALQKESKTVAANAVDLAKHPSRYAGVGASLAEGMAGESLGEMLGAGLGTIDGSVANIYEDQVALICGQNYPANATMETIIIFLSLVCFLNLKIIAA